MTFETVGKRGEWKTIDQRERSAAKARKTQRRGQAAVAAGAGAAGASYLAGHQQGSLTFLGRRNKAWEEAGDLKRAGGALRRAKLPLGEKARFAAQAIGKKPLGAVLAGGAGLAAVGGAGMFQGAVREGYHQNKINSRRKQRFGKNADFGVNIAKADRKTVKNGERVKINGRMVTIDRADFSTGQRMQHIIGQARAVFDPNNPRSSFVEPPYRAAQARSDSWRKRSYVRPGETNIKNESRLVLQRRGKNEQRGQRAFQGAAGAVAGGLAGTAVQSSRNPWARSVRNRYTLGGAAVGGALGAAIKPATHKLQFEEEHFKAKRGKVKKRYRNFDPEDARQRRAGAATGLAVGGGMLLAVKGGKAIRLTSAGNVIAKPKALAQTAGGGALIGTGAGIERHQRRNSGRRFE